MKIILRILKKYLIIEKIGFIFNLKKSLKDFKSLKKIGILGLAYKENTNSIKNSPSISFIKKISSQQQI